MLHDLEKYTLIRCNNTATTGIVVVTRHDIDRGYLTHVFKVTCDERGRNVKNAGEADLACVYYNTEEEAEANHSKLVAEWKGKV